MSLAMRFRCFVAACAALAATGVGCEKSPVPSSQPAPEASRKLTRDAASPPLAADPRTAPGVVAFLAALCTRAKAGDTSWVAKRVTLPLQGIHSLNDIDADPIVMPHENTDVEEFKYTRYCGMLPPAKTALRKFEASSESSSGLIDFGSVAHRVRFDLTSEPPRLVELDAQIAPTPIPPRPPKVRDYSLEAPPLGFTKDEPPGSKTLRRKVIKLLKSNPACIENYVMSDQAVARFTVATSAAATKPVKIEVMPFQLVRASLISCLRSQLGGAETLALVDPTNAIIEVIVPIREDEIGPDDAVLRLNDLSSSGE